jgi:hypothetical protein
MPLDNSEKQTTGLRAVSLPYFSTLKKEVISSFETRALCELYGVTKKTKRVRHGARS